MVAVGSKCCIYMLRLAEKYRGGELTQISWLASRTRKLKCLHNPWQYIHLVIWENYKPYSKPHLYSFLFSLSFSHTKSSSTITLPLFRNTWKQIELELGELCGDKSCNPSALVNSHKMCVSWPIKPTQPTQGHRDRASKPKHNPARMSQQNPQPPSLPSMSQSRKNEAMDRQ